MRLATPAASPSPLIGWAVWLTLALWLVFALTGFRMPWTPLGVSAEATGSRLRPLIFAGGACVAALALLRPAAWRWATQHRSLTIALVALLGLSAAWSAMPGTSAKRVILVACGFTGFLAAATCSARPREAWVRLLAGTLGAAAWVSLASYAVFPRACSVLAERPGLAGVSLHPNTLGPAMAIGFLCALCARTETPAERWLRPVLVLGCATALCLSGSMTSFAFAALGAGFTVLGTTRSGSYRRGVWQLLAFSGLALGTLLVLWVGIDALLGGVGRDASLTGRDVLWERLWDTGWNRPAFGHGFGGFWTPNRGRELVGTWNPRQAHNTYLDVFVELGFLGACGWALWLLGGLTRLWRDSGPSSDAALRGVCVGLLIYGCGESYWLRFDKVPFLCLAGAVVLPARGLPQLTPCEDEATS